MRKRIALLTLFLTLTALIGRSDVKPDTYAFAKGARSKLDQAYDKPGDRESIIKSLGDMASETRWVGAKKGAVAWVYTFFRGDGTTTVRVKFDEAPRELLVAQQFREVLKIAQNVRGGVQTEPAVQPIQMSRAQYILKLQRSTLTVSGTIEAGKGEDQDKSTLKDPDWIVVLDFTGGGETTNAKTASTSIITGDREGWSISANVPVGNVKQLSIDKEAKSIGLTDKPGAFYVAFDWAPWGDAYKTPTQWREAVQFLAMLKASNKPGDSFGVGVGLRPGTLTAIKIPKLLQIFDTFTPFVAVTRTRIPATGTATTRSSLGYRNDVVVGLSLDIKKGVEWTQKSDKTKE
jgi:hypothetical protein